MESLYRKKARTLRRFSMVFFGVAGVFTAAAVTLWVITEDPVPNIATLTCAVIIVTSGLNLRNAANTHERTARYWEMHA